jgi:hypothetical protein
MNPDQTTEAVWRFLTSNRDRAFLVSEVVAAARSPSGSEEEVLGAIDALAERGEVVSRSFPVRDPHLAFSSLRFVAAVDPAAGARQADVHTERAYQSWLREWLSSHRCC